VTVGAARGLDVKWIKTVVNFDAARDIQSHIHRIGRTGRAGTQVSPLSLVFLYLFVYCAV
jgi:ATP-dependent RNA helicase DDX42